MINLKFDKSLEKRFINFLDNRLESQNIDEIDIPPEHRDLKRADYVLNENIILELKSLESDPSHKIEKKIAPHRDRDEFPSHIGDIPLDEILKHLPDGDEINRAIFFSVTKSVQGCFEKADRQIRDTKTIISNSNASGVLAILNEEIDVFEPKIIAYIVRHMMNKRKKDGSYRYNNINFVYFISQAHFQQLNAFTAAFPLMIIDGPSATKHPHAIEYFEKLNREWSEFNNIPFHSIGYSPSRSLEEVFHSFKRHPFPENVSQKQQNELRQPEYKHRLYLQTLSEEYFITYGHKLMKWLEPYLLDGSPVKTTREAMFLWVHFK